jgi:hypothetical protein
MQNAPAALVWVCPRMLPSGSSRKAVSRRVWSHCRFRTGYVRESGMKWMSGGAKRQCDRALLPRRRARREGGHDQFVHGAAALVWCTHLVAVLLREETRHGPRLRAPHNSLSADPPAPHSGDGEGCMCGGEGGCVGVLDHGINPINPTVCRLSTKALSKGLRAQGLAREGEGRAPRDPIGGREQRALHVGGRALCDAGHKAAPRRERPHDFS